jgi:formylglycine-generating enzyme
VWAWTCDEYKPGHAQHAAASPCCAPRPDAADPFPRKVIKASSHLCAPNYCLRYRPAARQSETVETSTSHIGLRCIVRLGAKEAAPHRTG